MGYMVFLPIDYCDLMNTNIKIVIGVTLATLLVAGIANANSNTMQSMHESNQNGMMSMHNMMNGIDMEEMHEQCESGMTEEAHEQCENMMESGGCPMMQ